MQAARTPQSPLAGGPKLTGDPARRRREALIGRGLQACALVSVIITAFIIITVAGQAIQFLLEIDLTQLVAPGWFPRRG
ncbi:MAG TPA: hypothetical protein VI277_04385, partial [Candidatus Limnocylindria bacterium]